MLEKALPLLKTVLNLDSDIAELRANVHQLSEKLSGLTERVATLEGKLDSLPQVVKAIVDDRLMEVSRRRRHSLPG